VLTLTLECQMYVTSTETHSIISLISKVLIYVELEERLPAFQNPYKDIQVN